MSKKHSNRRSLDRLHSEGHLAETVEQWSAYSEQYHDLFNLFDTLVARIGFGVTGVQSTTKAHLARHRRKILEKPELKTWLMSGGGAEIWAWRKVGYWWQVRIDKFQISIDGRVEVVKVGNGTELPPPKST